jgi:hypothetical protein
MKQVRPRRGLSGESAVAADFLTGKHREDRSEATDLQFPVRVATIQKNADEELRVSIDEFRGHVLVDVRVFAAFTAARVPMATKKGLSLRIEQLPDLVEALKDAEATARKLGLLSG